VNPPPSIPVSPSVGTELHKWDVDSEGQPLDSALAGTPTARATTSTRRQIAANESLIQSYIPGFFVSTIYRQSSAAMAYAPWYYETIVWEWDAHDKERGAMLDQQDSGSCISVALRSHADICAALIFSEPHK
jgi:hypothetical protein